MVGIEGDITAGPDPNPVAGIFHKHTWNVLERITRRLLGKKARARAICEAASWGRRVGLIVWAMFSWSSGVDGVGGEAEKELVLMEKNILSLVSWSEVEI